MYSNHKIGGGNMLIGTACEYIVFHILDVPVISRGLCNALTLNVPPSAIVVQNDAKAKVVVLGTVHFSKKSVEEVSEVSY